MQNEPKITDYDPDKTEDLLPHEWTSERPKPKEPLFGSGLSKFILFMIWIFIVAAMKEYVIGPMMYR